MVLKTAAFAVLAFLLTFCKSAQYSRSGEEQRTFIGPRNGYLVLAGGGPDSASIRKFVSLAGRDSRILLVPTGIEEERLNPNYYAALKKIFENAGATNLEILHTRDTAIANSPEFISKLQQAKAVWFGGGNVRSITEVYLHTSVQDELQKLLDRDGVIGGNSAGANVIGSFFLKMDTTTNSFETDNAGFNFIKNTCIIPHLFEKNRESWFFEFNKRYGSLLGIGIDAATGVVIHENALEVIGRNSVAIYDGTAPPGTKQMHSKTGELFYLLTAGAKYDLEKRKVIK